MTMVVKGGLEGGGEWEEEEERGDLKRRRMRWV